MPAWEKRITTMTLKGIEQNMALGVHYFRQEALESGPEEIGVLRLDDGVEVLEEISNRGRVVIALPGERRVAVYAVDPAAGGREIAWYERTEALVAASPVAAPVS